MPTPSRFYILNDNRIIGQFELDHFPFVIGRSRDSDFVVDINGISRQHIKIDFDRQHIVLRDLGSKNGTFLNTENVFPFKDYPLRANDRVCLANVFELIFDDPATTAQLNVDRMLAEGIRLDETLSKAFIHGEPFDPPLSPSQIALLQLLIGHEGALVSRDLIRSHVWSADEEVSDQAIDALVSRLRRRLNEADPHHEYLLTRRGFGLIFNNPRPSLD